MIFTVNIILWVIALLLGFSSLVYDLFLLFKLSGTVKLNFGFLYFGLLAGYTSAVFSFLFQLKIISDSSIGYYALMVAVIFISYGAIKLVNMLWYIPESFLTVVNKKR